MQKLGYIVTKNKVNNLPSYIEVVQTISSVGDLSKPIMYIGLENARKHIDGFNILKKQYINDVFWTFGKREKRSDYENDIEWFYEFCIKKVINDIKYYYINVLIISLSKVKKLINIVNSSESKYIYISNRMIYIYYSNYIMGMSMDILEYCGVNKTKLLRKLHKNKSNIITYGDSFLDSKLKSFIANKKYAAAYFMTMM